MEPSLWEETLDVDDSDILLRPCKHHRRTTTTSAAKTTDAFELSQSQTLDSSQLQTETLTSPPLHTIPGPAGLIQAAKLRKKLDNQVEHPMDTQEEDADFKRGPWLSATEFAYPDGGKSKLGEIKNLQKNGKLDKVVAVIKSCAPNALGDLMVVLKDTTGTISGTIHHKVLTEGEFAKGICVGSVLILHKVSVFSPSRSAHNLNITMRNLVKVCYKDGGSSQIQTSGSAQDSGRGTQRLRSEFSLERGSEGINLTTNFKQSLHVDVEQETVSTTSSFGNQSSKTSNQGTNQETVTDNEILKETGVIGSCENERRVFENVTQLTEGNKMGPKGTDLVQIHVPATVGVTLPVYTDEELKVFADIENDI